MSRCKAGTRYSGVGLYHREQPGDDEAVTPSQSFFDNPDDRKGNLGHRYAHSSRGGQDESGVRMTFRSPQTHIGIFFRCCVIEYALGVWLAG